MVDYFKVLSGIKTNTGLLVKGQVWFPFDLHVTGKLRKASASFSLHVKESRVKLFDLSAVAVHSAQPQHSRP
jgi:hypothetical protein